MITVKKTLILTDNLQACELALELNRLHGGIDVRQSPNGHLAEIPRLNIRDSIPMVISTYNLILSIHCKQFFPAELVNGIRCVNIHPGLNPYNRGWFPQVFSIINGLPSGVTIHEIDEKIDHGPIITQKEYKIESWDTSDSAYEKIMAIERELLLKNFVAIRDQTYKATVPKEEGNINYKKDFENLKQIDLRQHGTYGEFINRLRALTHHNYKNAYFIDNSGTKVFITINLEPDIS
jgi:dTDP-4-amino-4,6-dideoxyglucose formyltransferase